MSEQNNEIVKKETTFDLTTIISNAIKIPGVKVNREAFLREQFKDCSPETISSILEKGPIELGLSREDLRKKANRIIKERTAISTGASVAAGIPGGIAMAATIPADILQFYAVALRMAQELIYLYGEEDLWCEGSLDYEKVQNQLILYCGVMLGATGAAQTVRVMSSALAKQALNKLPQKALTKTFYYPIVKSILKFFGVSVTKSTFAKGVSKVIPIVGGVVSGGITLASMLPMGNRLLKTLDKAHFDYTNADFESDINDINTVKDQEESEKENLTEKIEDNVDAKPKKGLWSKKKPKKTGLEEIREAKQMLDEGLITEEEFAEIKAKVISNM